MISHAVSTLRSVDFICAEDTRVTMKLLNYYETKKPLVSYHEHNAKAVGSIICDRIAAGENAAIVTDAGMPCISDPGEQLVKLCAERGICVRFGTCGKRSRYGTFFVRGLSQRTEQAAFLSACFGSPKGFDAHIL